MAAERLKDGLDEARERLRRLGEALADALLETARPPRRLAPVRLPPAGRPVKR